MSSCEWGGLRWPRAAPGVERSGAGRLDVKEARQVGQRNGGRGPLALWGIRRGPARMERSGLSRPQLDSAGWDEPVGPVPGSISDSAPQPGPAGGTLPNLSPTDGVMAIGETVEGPGLPGRAPTGPSRIGEELVGTDILWRNASNGQRSQAASQALLSLAGESGVSFPDGLFFETQAGVKGGSIPDMIGFRSGGVPGLIIEAKFDAKLTDAQPTEYLRAFSETEPGLLVFVLGPTGSDYQALVSKAEGVNPLVLCQSVGTLGFFWGPLPEAPSTPSPLQGPAGTVRGRRGALSCCP